MKKILFLILLLMPVNLFSGDWPVYKGNLYFTGNNDEIIVKNNNLKWLFQADERVFNPVVSDGRIYFLDRNAYCYCLDEEYGKLIWKVNVRRISEQFKKLSRVAGKVKYPLIVGNLLILTDPVAIYALDKRNGRVLWARTGMRLDQVEQGQGLAGRRTRPLVDGIYSDPVIHQGRIFYGTRQTFMSRELSNGHLKWNNDSVKSFSGFPSYYDNYIFTQSMNYSTGVYKLHCLDNLSGKEKWSVRIQKPFKIFPPVVYKQNVYIPSGKTITCLDLSTGEKKWIRDYGRIITSNPGFTDRAILFSVDNSDIMIIDPPSGNVVETVKVAEKSAPYFVVVRDQLYVAYNGFDKIKKKTLSYGKLQAINFSDKTRLWSYKTPFPGAVSQPIASKGIMFFPSGNYLYAIGTEYYSKVVDGGSGFATIPGKGGSENSLTKLPKPPVRDHSRIAEKKLKLRNLELSILDKNKTPLNSVVDIKKRDKQGRIIYSQRERVSGKAIVKVPDEDGVEIIVNAPEHLPKKVYVSKKDKRKDILLDRLEKGKPVVVDNIEFEVNKAYLRKRSLDILDDLIKLMKSRKNLKFRVYGHTDSTGESSYNQKLSERRADSVVEYMIKNGISPERLEAKGFGETKPIASNKTPEGRRKNRRTEFFLVD